MPGLEVGYGYVAVEPSFAGFWSEATRQLTGSDMTRLGQRAGQSLGDEAARTANQNLVQGIGGGQVNSAAADAGQQAGTRFGGGFRDSVASHLKMLGTMVAGAVGIAVTASATIGVKTAAQMQQASIAFTTMLGSGAKAQDFLVKLQKFAAATPFEFPELQTAAQSLISIGIQSEKVIPIMTTLGNVTAGMGTGSQGIQRATVALQQMNAAGKISAEDLNQLRDAGIPVFDLLTAATGKTTAQIADMANKGKLGRTELTQLMSALETGKGLDRFNGMMEKQSQSLSGMVSTLKDTFSVGMAQVLMPFMPMMTAAVGGVTSLLERALPVLQAWAQTLADAFPRIQAGAQGLFTLLAKGDYTQSLGQVLGIGENDKIVASILAVRESIVGLFASMRQGGSESFASSFKNLDLTAVASGVSALGQSLVAAVQMAPVFSSAFGVAGTVLGFFADHVDTLVQLMPVILAGFAAWHVAMAANAVLGRDSAAGVVLTTAAALIQRQAAQSLAVAYTQQAAALTAVTEISVLHTDAQGAQTAITVSNTLSTEANTAAQNTGVLARARAAAASAWHTVALGAQTAATWVATTATTAFNAALAFLATPIGIAVAAVALLVGGFILLYRNSETVRNAVDGLWSSLKTSVVGAWEGSIKPALAGFWSLITDGLVPAIQGFWSTTVAPIFAQVGAAALTLWGYVQQGFGGWQSLVQNNLAPVLLSLWVNVIAPTFTAIGQLISVVWSAVIQPALAGFSYVISNVVAPVVSWLWTNIVGPIFSFIGGYISVVFSKIVLPALAGVCNYLANTLFPSFRLMWPVVSMVFDAVGAKISTVGHFISGVFDQLKNGVRAVQSTFEVVTAAIGSVWESMKAKVEEPVKFVVNDIVRDKLVAGWNEVAKKVGLPTWKFKGFSGGGWTGPGDKDQAAGIVHADEFVIQKKSQRSISRRAPGFLDALNRRGAEALDALGAPGWANGGMVYQAMQGWLNQHVPFAKVTSSYRPGSITATGNTSYHASGRALDSVATGGHSMMEIFNAIKAAWPGSAEIIYSPANAAQVHNGKPHLYGEPTRSMHFNHVHWAMKAFDQAYANAAGGSLLDNPIGGGLKALISGPFNAARALIAGMAEKFGSTELVGLAQAVAQKPVDSAQKFITDMIDKVFPSFSIPGVGGGDSASTAGAGLTGVKAAVNAAAAKRGWGSGAQWDAIDWLVSHESSWNPLAKNPSSTAYGLFQFLDSTWGAYGIPKTSDPARQGEAGMRYIAARYGTPMVAKQFWQAHHYYSDGGLVRPHLYDQGGVLPPGVTVAVNKTGRNETIRTHEQEADIQAQLRGPAMINHFHVPDRDIATEVIDRLRHEDIRRRARDLVMTRG